MRSIDHGNRVDLDETTRIGRQPDDLNRRRCRLGLTEILRPDTIQRVLIAEIGDKAIGGDDIGKACAHRLQTAFEIVERRPSLPLHIRRHGVELFWPVRVVMIDRSGGDTGQVDGRATPHLDHRRIGHPQIGGVGPMHMLDDFWHGALFREADMQRAKGSTKAARKASWIADSTRYPGIALTSYLPRSLLVRVACGKVPRMADEPPPDVRDIFDDAWESAQRLAIDVIQYPAEKRDAVLQRMGTILTEIAGEAGCPHEMAREFGAATEQPIREYVSGIKASGGGITGTA